MQRVQERGLADSRLTDDVQWVIPAVGSTTGFDLKWIVGPGRHNVCAYAVDRRTDSALPNTRLKLVLNQQGFERTFALLTDASGGFTIPRPIGHGGLPASGERTLTQPPIRTLGALGEATGDAVSGASGVGGAAGASGPFGPSGTPGTPRDVW